MSKKKTETEEAVIIEEIPANNGNQQIVKHETLSLMPIKDMEKWYKEFKAFNERILTKGLDYGTIPGISKPSLFKPGAEKMRFVYGLGVHFQLISEESNFNSDPAFFDYSYRATIMSKTGQILAQCDANCNSHEPKFRYTWMDCPKQKVQADEDQLKAEKKGRWKKAGSGWQWQERIENPDIAGLKNTIMKMSEKRAFVGAMLIATGASEYFTQDIEDMDIGKDEDGPKGTDAPKTEPAKPAAPKEEKKPEAQPKAEEKKEEIKLETSGTTDAAATTVTQTQTDKAEDPTGSILGEGDDNLNEEELSILALHKKKVDGYTNYETLRKNAEEIVFECMMDGLTTDKAQHLRTYCNKYYKFLKSKDGK